jgi:acylphosphatase
MVSARRYIVSGLVQGVGFRYFVVQRAAERQLTGWVKNLVDGRVEILAEGSEESLDGFGGDLAIGSRFSKVAKVEQRDEPGEGRHPSFSVAD